MAKRRKSGELRASIPQETNRKTKSSSSRGAPRSKSPSLRARIPAGAASRRLSPFERACELALKAMQSRDPDRQIELAQQALELSEDCADAYVLLSRYVEGPRQALVLLEQGLAAAERGLGPQWSSELVGHNLLALETRP